MNVDVWKRRFIFAKCTFCEDLISKVGKSNPCVKEYEIKLKKITFTRNLVDVYITLGELNLCN